MISLFQKQGVAQKAGQDETGTESHMQASDDFNAHFPMGRQGSGMYKTPRAQGRAGLGSSEPGPLGQGELGAEQGSAARSLGPWGRACTHVPLCTRTEDTFSW